MTTALYPGSFDPVHNGHLAVIELVAPLFDELIIAVGHNPGKASGRFTGPERAELIVQALADTGIGDRGSIRVELFSGLVTAAAAELGADCLVKGLRSGTDLDTEMLQANMNATTGGGLPTIFAPGLGQYALVSSRYVREISAAGGDVTEVVPASVAEALSGKGGDG
jgi:pantetheine-phosphate adenylyltransferase